MAEPAKPAEAPWAEAVTWETLPGLDTAAAGRMLAMTEAWPNWVEGDEFRAARDKSRPAAK